MQIEPREPRDPTAMGRITEEMAKIISGIRVVAEDESGSSRSAQPWEGSPTDGPCPQCGGNEYVAEPRSREILPGRPATYLVAVPCSMCHELRRRQRLAQRAARISAECGLSKLQLTWTFERFEVYEGNEAAYAAARQFAENPGANWLAIAGERSTGKTHLMCAIATKLIDRGVPVLYAYVPLLLDWLRQGYRHLQELEWAEYGDFDQRLQRLMTVDLLLLDDLGAEKTTDWAAEKLTSVFDQRLLHERPLVVTTNIDATVVEDSLPRIYSRLQRHPCSTIVRNLATPLHERSRQAARRSGNRR